MLELSDPDSNVGEPVTVFPQIDGGLRLFPFDSASEMIRFKFARDECAVFPPRATATAADPVNLSFTGARTVSA